MIVTSGGIFLSLGSAISRFSNNMGNTAIIMGDSITATKLATEFKTSIASIKTIDKNDGAKLLKNWVSESDALASYIPYTLQIRTKTQNAIEQIKNRATAMNLKFISGASATPDRSIGLKIMFLSGFVFILIFSALGVCIIHSVRNIITIHKREIEILNQIGSTNRYIAGQIQQAMFGIMAKTVSLGFVGGSLMLLIINTLSRSSHVGLLANMGLSFLDWMILLIMAVLIIITTAIISNKTTMKILDK
jgi:cell division protein FtsX